MLRVSRGTNNFRRASGKSPPRTTTMFLLALCLLAWSLSVLLVACASWLLSLFLRFHFHLYRAEILIVEPHNESCRIKAVDVTEEMRMLGKDGPTSRLSVLPSLAKAAPHKVSDLAVFRNRTFRGREPPAAGAGNRRRRRRPACATPLCFVDIRYTAQPNRLLGLLVRDGGYNGSYRCLYPLYSYTDAIAYPPLRSCEWRTNKKSSSISNAVLTMRLQGRPTSQLFCNVTDRLRPLEGPLHDFHRTSHPGYQLRKHILRAVLGSDIQALHDSARVDGGFGLDPATTAAASSTSTASSSTSSSSTSSTSSSSSLISSPERPSAAHNPSSADVAKATEVAGMSISVRFQFRSHDHRTDVMTLRAS